MKLKTCAAITRMIVCLASGAVPIVAVTSATAQTAGDRPPNTMPKLKCVELTGWKIPGSTVVIAKAQEVPEAPPGTVHPNPTSPATVEVTIPSNCLAEGMMDERVGVDDKPYAIRFALALPDRWNGR